MASFKEVYDAQITGENISQAQIIQAIVNECDESLDETNWKWWKKSYSKENVTTEELKEEVADIFIFAILLAKSSGMNSEELVNKIADKTNYNFKRDDHVKYEEVKL